MSANTAGPAGVSGKSVEDGREPAAQTVGARQAPGGQSAESQRKLDPHAVHTRFSPGIQRGRLVVLAGPSGVGKSTLVRAIRDRVPELLFSVSVTTRDPRPGEVEGQDYYYVSRDEFARMIADNELLEWAEIHGGLQRSGTPAVPVRAALAAGRPVLADIDIEGSRSVKQVMPEAIRVFIAPPSWEELVARLKGRGTESPEVIERRLETARMELAATDEFDMVIVNRDVESTCAELVSLLVGRPAEKG